MPSDDKPKPPPKPEKKIPAPPKALKQMLPKLPSLAGDKIRAGRQLSSFLRKIAQEETENVTGPDGEVLMTKAEALARRMFQMALGYSEFNVKTGKTVYFGADKGMIALIWDRMEGRAVATDDSDAKKRTLPKKVSEANKQRINDMVKANDTDGNMQT
jgi:hypothetical protein